MPAEYSARQQYWPIALPCGPVAVDNVAPPFPSTTFAPSGGPRDPHSFPARRSSDLVTVPVGVGCPAAPAIVAVSVTDVPGTTPLPVGFDAVVGVDGCFTVVKNGRAKVPTSVTSV